MCNQSYSNRTKALVFISAMLEAHQRADVVNMSQYNGANRMGPNLRNHAKLGIEKTSRAYHYPNYEETFAPGYELELYVDRNKKVPPLSSLSVRTIKEGTVQHERVTNRDHDVLKRQFCQRMIEDPLLIEILRDWFYSIIPVLQDDYMALLTDLTGINEDLHPIPEKVTITQISGRHSKNPQWLVQIKHSDDWASNHWKYDNMADVFSKVATAYGINVITAPTFRLTRAAVLSLLTQALRFSDNPTPIVLFPLDMTGKQPEDFKFLRTPEDPTLAEDSIISLKTIHSGIGTVELRPYNAVNAKERISPLAYITRILFELTEDIKTRVRVELDPDYDDVLEDVVGIIKTNRQGVGK